MPNLVSISPSRTSSRKQERALRAFEAQAGQGEAKLATFWLSWKRRHSASVSTLVTLIKRDIEARYEAGERPRVADYIDRFPELKADSSKVVSLIYEEFCLRDEFDGAPDSTDFCQGYHAWGDSVRSQLAYHQDLNQLMRSDRAVQNFPEVGEKFDRYTLNQVLGTGAAARVYRATEAELDREIVLKVSEAFGHEPAILARLDHRNIVPILHFARSESGQRGICMPYRPGITLEELIRRLGHRPPPSKAVDLWKLIHSTAETAVAPLAESCPGWDGFPMEGSFSEAIAWIGLALLDALKYLHEHDILHRDIKPANILLAFREGPQLLDFNLAKGPARAEAISASMRGGTLPYMAPEHLHAFLEISGWEHVENQADLYSLGLVLRELLTGDPPDLPEPGTSLQRSIQGLIFRRAEPWVPTRSINPLIPPSLDSILEKCLAFEPENRYPTAHQLAADLRCFLERLPLLHADNASSAERGSNWIFRNRLLVKVLGPTILIGAGLLWLSRPQPIPERSDFLKAEAQLNSTDSREWEKARQTFDRLHKEYPGSAWPSILLAMTLEKYDPRKIEEANILTRNSFELPDAEDVYLSLLKKEPNSCALLTKYGLLLIRQGRSQEARIQLDHALLRDPDQITALSARIGLEKTLGNHTAVVEQSIKLIELAVKNQLNPESLYLFRYRMIASLALLVDKKIANLTIPEERQELDRYLNLIESTVADMIDDRKYSKNPKNDQNHEQVMLFHQFYVISCRGKLALDSHDPLRARDFLDQATTGFRVMLANLSPKIDPSGRYQIRIREQQAILEKRLDELARLQRDMLSPN